MHSRNTVRFCMLILHSMLAKNFLNTPHRPRGKWSELKNMYKKVTKAQSDFRKSGMFWIKQILAGVLDFLTLMKRR